MIAMMMYVLFRGWYLSVYLLLTLVVRCGYIVLYTSIPFPGVAVLV